MIVLVFFLTALASAAQTAEPAAVAQQARAALAAGDFDTAAALYRRLIAQLPNVGGLRMNLALALFQGGKYKAAASELQAALKLEPGLAPASMMLGLCHARLGQPLAAIPLLERALQNQPGNTVVLLELADSYFAAGQFEPASVHFRRLTALEPGNPTAWRGLGLSLTELSQALFGRLVPGSAEALTLLARARLAADEPKAAFSLLKQALAVNPAFGPAHEYLAGLYRQAGRPDWAAASSANAGPPTGLFAEVVATSDQALEAFALLEALGPSAALYETQAEAARARGRHPEAIAAWRLALALKPAAPNLERGLARALFAGRNFEEALPLLTKHGLTYEIGEALLETGKPAEAIPYLIKIRTPAAQAALGRAYLAINQPAKAVAPLRAGLASDIDGSTHFQLARALQRTGAAAQASEMDRMAQRIRQKKAEQLDALGAIAITPF